MLSLRPDLAIVTLATVFGLFSVVSGVNALVLAAQLRPTAAATRPEQPVG